MVRVGYYILLFYQDYESFPAYSHSLESGNTWAVIIWHA